jgi:hypothetical protein
MITYLAPEVISSGTANVSTLTVIKAFIPLGHEYHTLVFVVTNLDATNTVTMLVETTEDGTHPDAVAKWTVDIPALKQGSVELGPNVLRKYWRISANSPSPTFPTCAVTWEIKGSFRRT